MNQLTSEFNATKSLNSDVQWETKVFSHDSIVAPFQVQVKNSNGRTRIVRAIKDYIYLRLKAYFWFLKHRNSYDVILFRYRSGDIFLFFLSKIFNNVFTIHHSKEIDEAKTRYGSGGKIEELIEKHLGKRTLMKVSGIIGVTNEIVNYELDRIHKDKPTFCYSSGIDTRYFPIAIDERTNTINLIFISSNYTRWHGLDLLINEIKKSKESFKLHIVGGIESNIFENDSRIVFYGRRNRDFILEIMGKCDIGLGSFALNRIGLSESCHLKVREYLAAGLPVYSGFPDSGIPKTFPYYTVGQLKIEKILEFAQECRKFSRQEVRQLSEKFIDKLKIMQDLVDWLKNQGYSH